MKKSLNKIAEKIAQIEKSHIDETSAVMEIESLIKDLDFEDLILLDDKIQEYLKKIS